MNQHQYETVTGLTKQDHQVRFDQLKDPTPRTLIYGYDLDRSTVHVYTNGIEFVVLRYAHGKDPHTVIRTQVLTASHMPSKRAYPEACDFDMACLLKQTNIEVSYTTFNPDRPEAEFYGLIAIEDVG